MAAGKEVAKTMGEFDHSKARLVAAPAEEHLKHCPRCDGQHCVQETISAADATEATNKLREAYDDRVYAWEQLPAARRTSKKPRHAAGVKQTMCCKAAFMHCMNNDDGGNCPTCIKEGPMLVGNGFGGSTGVARRPGSPSWTPASACNPPAARPR